MPTHRFADSKAGLKRLAPFGIVIALLVTMAALLYAAPAAASAENRAASLGPPTVGLSPPQVGLTISYSVVGGGDSQSQDLLTYVANNLQRVATLTEAPSVYMCDVGTQWSVLSVLNGSTSS